MKYVLAVRRNTILTL